MQVGIRPLFGTSALSWSISSGPGTRITQFFSFSGCLAGGFSSTSTLSTGVEPKPDCESISVNSSSRLIRGENCLLNERIEGERIELGVGTVSEVDGREGVLVDLEANRRREGTMGLAPDICPSVRESLWKYGQLTRCPALSILSKTVALPINAVNSNDSSLRLRSSSNNGLISTSHFPYLCWNERRCIVDAEIRFLVDAVDLLEFLDFKDSTIRVLSDLSDRFERDEGARAAMSDIWGSCWWLRGGREGPPISSSVPISAMPD